MFKIRHQSGTRLGGLSKPAPDSESLELIEHGNGVLERSGEDTPSSDENHY